MTELSTRNKFLIMLGISAFAFALGRYSVTPPTVKTEITDTSKETKKVADDVHTTTKETITEQPNGAKTIEITQNQDTISKEFDSDTNHETETQTITPAPKNQWNVSLLGAVQFNSLTSPPSYGVSVTKQVLGPVTVGVFGLSNTTTGVSVGLSF